MELVLHFLHVLNTNWGFNEDQIRIIVDFLLVVLTRFLTANGMKIVNVGKDTQYLRIGGNPMGTESTYGREAIRVHKNNTVEFTPVKLHLVI